jgi:hypothetical protein
VEVGDGDAGVAAPAEAVAPGSGVGEAGLSIVEDPAIATMVARRSGAESGSRCVADGRLHLYQVGERSI